MELRFINKTGNRHFDKPSYVGHVATIICHPCFPTNRYFYRFIQCLCAMVKALVNRMDMGDGHQPIFIRDLLYMYTHDVWIPMA